MKCSEFYYCFNAIYLCSVIEFQKNRNSCTKMPTNVVCLTTTSVKRQIIAVFTILYNLDVCWHAHSDTGDLSVDVGEPECSRTLPHSPLSETYMCSRHRRLSNYTRFLVQGGRTRRLGLHFIFIYIFRQFVPIFQSFAHFDSFSTRHYAHWAYFVQFEAQKTVSYY